MAKTYRLSMATRITNSIFQWLTKAGVGASYRHVLTVPGRKTGRLHSTPVDVMDHGGSRWLVAGYGRANWVQNARAARKVTLTRGARSEEFAVEDVVPTEAVPVLRQYMSEVRVTRRYFDAARDAPDDATLAEHPKHPVLRVTAMRTSVPDL